MAGYSIFIAHAPADTRLAAELTRLLAETGAIVVYGAESSPTPEALDDLERAALAADAYMALLSRASIASPRIRSVTRKYHEQRQTDPRRILLPVVLEPFPPEQQWPFLLDHPRIEAIPRTINEVSEQGTIKAEALALAVMLALQLPIPARLRGAPDIPNGQLEGHGRMPRPISAPIAGSLVPQLHPPPSGSRRSRQALVVGGVGAVLLALLVATVAFASGATPFHLAGSTRPSATATIRTLILATDMASPAATVAPTAAPTATVTPKRTATPLPTPTATPIPVGTGLTGHYYQGTALQEPVALTRLDPTIDFDWSNTAPDPLFQGMGYSVRWTGQVRATVSDTYTITFISDDGVRLYWNGVTSPPAIDDWNDHAPTADAFTVTLTAGQYYPITIEYYENGVGSAVAHLEWAIGASGSPAILPTAQLYAQ
jgi:hypothetical protein